MTRILAVDDSPSMRQMVGVTLKSARYEVLEACDGREALNIAKEQAAVDLVITDVNMPNMDGRLLRWARQRMCWGCRRFRGSWGLLRIRWM